MGDHCLLSLPELGGRMIRGIQYRQVTVETVKYSCGRNSLAVKIQYRKGSGLGRFIL